MPRQRDTRGAATPRRGFVFLMVLMLLGIGTITITAGLIRTDFRARVAQQRLESYRRHHELLGVRDLVFTWLNRAETDEILALAASGDDAYRIALNESITIRITVADGQGTIRLRDLDAIGDPLLREWMIEVLGRIPPERMNDLTRRVGPVPISLHGIPDVLIDAIAGDDSLLGSGLREARDKRVEDASGLLRTLLDIGVDANVAQTTARRFVFTPQLWRFDIEAFHHDLGISRRYLVLAQKGDLSRAGVTKLHEWRYVEDGGRSWGGPRPSWAF